MIDYVIPLLLAGVALFALSRRENVYAALLDGATNGLKLLATIAPALIMLLTAVHMLRASGAMEAMSRILSPVVYWLGIPPETAPLALIRPLSGSGSLAALEDVLQTYGADSIAGRTAAVMMSSTETTFYAVAVYYGAVGVKRSRYTIPCALVGDLTGLLASAWIVRLLFF